MSESGSLPRILFTTDLTEKQKKRLSSNYFTVSSFPFISFDMPDAKRWQSQIPVNYDSWIFTSKRAVKSIKPVLNSLLIPEHIFVVGEKTAQKLEELSIPSHIPNEYNLQSLASLMNEFDLKNAIHFCGNLKAGDLSKLLNDKVKLTSVEVYRTELNPQEIDVSEFDGFVFMSPSAVDSFHQKNTLTAESTVFCIGPSTANALEKFGIVSYLMAEKSTFKSLTESIHKFYSNDASRVKK